MPAQKSSGIRVQEREILQEQQQGGKPCHRGTCTTCSVLLYVVKEIKYTMRSYAKPNSMWHELEPANNTRPFFLTGKQVHVNK